MPIVRCPIHFRTIRNKVDNVINQEYSKTKTHKNVQLYPAARYGVLERSAVQFGTDPKRPRNIPFRDKNAEMEEIQKYELFMCQPRHAMIDGWISIKTREYDLTGSRETKAKISDRRTIWPRVGRALGPQWRMRANDQSPEVAKLMADSVALNN